MAKKTSKNLSSVILDNSRENKSTYINRSQKGKLSYGKSINWKNSKK